MQIQHTTLLRYDDYNIIMLMIDSTYANTACNFRDTEEQKRDFNFGFRLEADSNSDSEIQTERPEV